MLALSRVEGTNGQRKDKLMARSKPSARNALKKLREQREELDAQETRLREEAAGELGKVLLECGAETIEPAQLKQLIRASLTIGRWAKVRRVWVSAPSRHCPSRDLSLILAELPRHMAGVRAGRGAADRAEGRPAASPGDRHAVTRPSVPSGGLLDRLLTSPDWRGRLKINPPDGLQSRLLILTVLFTLAVGALIMLPNAANFHETWLQDRLQAAELASVGVEALPYNAVDDETAEQLLRIGGVSAVAISDQGVMRQLLRAPDLPRAPDFIDLRRRNTGARLWEPIETLLSRPDRSIRVRAAPRYRTGDFIDVVAPAEPLRQELRAFLVNSLLVSLIISAAAGGLLYAGLAFLVLRPLRRVTRSIESFAADPLLPGAEPSDRGDEIGRVERELARMQEEVRQSLRSRSRLVALGQALAFQQIGDEIAHLAQVAQERVTRGALFHQLGIQARPGQR
jgi:hypothetical protein